MTKKLPLIDSPRTNIFRGLVDILRNDKDLGKVVRPDAWKVFEGDPSDASGLAPLQGVSIRLYPVPGEVSWLGPYAMVDSMIIQVEACVPGLMVDDVLNLQHALERAIYPQTWTARAARMTSFQAMGAVSGMVHFASSMWDRSAEMGTSGNWYPIGQLQIDVMRVLTY